MATRAVLTGDIVASTTLDPDLQQRLGGAIVDAAGELRGLWPRAAIAPASVFRGDSWQLYVGDGARALRVAIWLRARLRIATDPLPGLETRVGIGLGNVEVAPVDGRSGVGDAYVLSGRALDRLPRGRLMGIEVAGSRDVRRPGLRPLIGLVDAIAGRWTERQCRAIVGTLAKRSQREIAGDWPGGPATQQAIADHLRNAAWTPVAEAIEFFEEVVRAD